MIVHGRNARVIAHTRIDLRVPHVKPSGTNGHDCNGGTSLLALNFAVDGDNDMSSSLNCANGMTCTFITMPTSYYHIQAVKAMSGTQTNNIGFLSTAGSTVDMWDCGGAVSGCGENQRWILVPRSKNGVILYYYIMLESSSQSTGTFYLSASADGTYVDMYDHDDGSGRQRWLLENHGSYWNIRIYGGMNSGTQASRSALEPSPDPRRHCLREPPVPWRVQDYLSTYTDGSALDFGSSDDGDENERFILHDFAY